MSFHAALAAAEAVVSRSSPRRLSQKKPESELKVLNETKQSAGDDATDREKRPTLHPPLMSGEGENAWSRLEESLKAHKGLLDSVEATGLTRAGGGGTSNEKEEERKEPRDDEDKEEDVD